MVRQVQFRQAFGSHTLALVTTQASNVPVTQQSYIPEGTAVRILWGTTPNGANYWYGYVHHREVQGANITYVLIGTSAVFDSAGDRTWNAVSASYVIRSLATQHGLRSFIHATPNPAEYIAQAGQTDFQLMTGLADQHGYRLWVDCANVYLTSPREILLSPSERSVVNYTRSGATSDTIFAFTLTQGSGVSSPQGGIAARRVVFGIDQASGQTTQAVSNPTASTRTIIVPPANVDSYSDALAEAAAASGRNDTWVTAAVTVRGNVRVAPGTLVNLLGQGLPLGCAGIWLVESAEHTLSPGGAYDLSIKVGRNEGTSQQVSNVRRLQPTSEFSPCVLQDGLWRSQQLQEVVYA